MISQDQYDYLLRQMDAMLTVQREIVQSLDKVKTVTVAEFSEATGVPSKTVLYWCKAGILRATQKGDGFQWLILKSEIDDVVKLAASNVRDESKRSRAVVRFYSNHPPVKLKNKVA